MSDRAFITITEDGPNWSLIRGGPSGPLQEAARIAGVQLRWSTSDRAWLIRTSQVADLVAAGEHARLLTVRASS